MCDRPRFAVPIFLLLFTAISRKRGYFTIRIPYLLTSRLPFLSGKR